MGKTHDLTGMKFRKLLVISQAEPRIEPSGKRRTMWNCRCDCGNECTARATDLVGGRRKSCGCSKSGIRKQITWKRIREQPQQKFGKLKVIREAEDYVCPDGEHITQVKCICDCGKEIIVMARELLRGHVTSCGCRTQSIGAENIEQYLIANNVKYLSEVSLPLCVNPETNTSLRFDFALIDEDISGTILCVVEYQGMQHYEDCGEFGRLQRETTDIIKKNYCEKNNLPLYEIRYDEDEIKTIETIVSQYRR